MISAFPSRIAPVEPPATLSIASGILVETMNGLIGINLLQGTGLKRWQLCLVILMNQDMAKGLSKEAQDCSGIPEL